VPKIEPDRPRPKKEVVPGKLHYKFSAHWISIKQRISAIVSAPMSIKRHILGIGIKVHVVGSIQKGAHSRKLCFFCVRIGYFLTVLQYIIVPFLLLFSFSVRNSRTEEPHSVFRQNLFCQRENSDKNESNDGLHKKWTSNKNEPIFHPSMASRQKVNVPF
jgi:hypothetical protein